MPIIDPYDKEPSGIVDPYEAQESSIGGPSLASKFYRPALEYGGLAIGGIIGTPAGPVGNVAGAGLGYGMGKGLADVIEGKQPQELGAGLMKGGKDVLQGAGMEAGGAILGKAISAGGRALANSGAAERFYSSSIKMPLAQKWVKARGPEGTSNVKAAVSKGLKEEVPPSELGLEITKSGKKAAAESLDREVSGMAETYSVDSILKEGMKKAIDKAVKGEAPMKDIETIKMFAENLKAGRSGEISASELNSLKKELYQRADYDKLYGKADSLMETLRKGVAHEARIRLQETNPALQSLNADYKDWKLLEEAIERSLARRNNRDIVDLSTKVLIGRESWPVAIFNQTVGHPTVKSKIAFMLNKSGRITGAAVSRPAGYLSGGLMSQ